MRFFFIGNYRERVPPLYAFVHDDFSSTTNQRFGFLLETFVFATPACPLLYLRLPIIAKKLTVANLNMLILKKKN
jgi:hypothetical protein